MVFPFKPSIPQNNLQLKQEQLPEQEHFALEYLIMASPYSYTSTPRSCYPQAYHPALHYRPSIPRDYLPNDEHRYLVKQQERSRLEAHFEQLSSSSRYLPSRTAYQEIGNLSRGRRAEISEMANATRAALGASFDFTDEGYDRIQAADNDRYASSRYRDGSGYAGYVPSRRVQDLSEKYWDDDRRYRKEQYRKQAYNPPVSSYADTGFLPRPEPTPQRRERHDSGIGQSPMYVPTPQLNSTFSWGSHEEDKPKKRRRWKHPRWSKRWSERWSKEAG